MKNDARKICGVLLDVISKFYERDSKARTFGVDTELYHSEIHMLQCIDENPGLHISGLARLLGITRGAASQTAKRLERKRMIVKSASPENGKIVLLQLTQKGRTASCNHRNAHKRYSEIVEGILAGTTAEQRDFLADFLLRFETALKSTDF